MLGTPTTRPLTATLPEMGHKQAARDAVWRLHLRVQATADGRAAHQPKPDLPQSRRAFLWGFLCEPLPVSNTLPNFLSGDEG